MAQYVTKAMVRRLGFLPYWKEQLLCGSFDRVLYLLFRCTRWGGVETLAFMGASGGDSRVVIRIIESN